MKTCKIGSRVIGEGSAALSSPRPAATTMAIGVAENQRGNLNDFAKAGTIAVGGNKDEKDLESTFGAVFDSLRSDDVRRAMTSSGRTLADAALHARLPSS